MAGLFQRKGWMEDRDLTWWLHNWSVLALPTSLTIKNGGSSKVGKDVFYA